MTQQWDPQGNYGQPGVPPGHGGFPPATQPAQGRGLAMAPTSVKVAFWLQLAAVALLAILGLVAIVLASQDLGNPFLSDEDYAFALFVLIAGCAGILQAVGLAVASKFLLDGSNAARIASVVGLASTLLTNCLALLVAIPAIILLFVGGSAAWFARRTP